MFASVVVIGSANVDLVVPVERHPASGETLLGGDLTRHPGGKGANQAVGSAKAGGVPTALIACLGDDDASELLRHSLVAGGVEVSLLQRGESTGTALIWVTPQGDNTIIVAPGANSELQLTPESLTAIESAKVVLSQLEIPLGVVQQAAESCPADVPFVLNAAPSQSLPPELLSRVDVLVVNEHEATGVAGHEGTPGELVRSLLEQVPAVVMTLGADGVLVGRRDHPTRWIKALEVEAVDTTGAGDVFCGVLCAGLARGLELLEASEAAAVAGALTTTNHGAQDSIPTSQAVGEHAQTVSLITDRAEPG